MSAYWEQLHRSFELLGLFCCLFQALFSVALLYDYALLLPHHCIERIIVFSYELYEEFSL